MSKSYISKNIREDEEKFCRSLSRKELQNLCKKYGLPARKSTSEMVNSLISYFQNDLLKKSTTNSVNGMQERLYPPSSLSRWHTEAPQYLSRNVIKDNCQQISFPQEGWNGGNRNTGCNELGTCLGLTAVNKEGCGGSSSYFQGGSQSLCVSLSAGDGIMHKESFSGMGVDTHQCCCSNLNACVCPTELLSPAIRTYTKVPASFEFYISSDDGIELCVDLSSSPSDWISKYNNPISLSTNVRNGKFRGLHGELGRIGESNKQLRSSFMNTGPGESNNEQVQAEPSPSGLVEKHNVVVDFSSGGNKSPIPSPASPCTVVSIEGLDCLVGNLGPSPSKLNSDSQKKIISHAESYSRNGPADGSDTQKQIILDTEPCIQNGSSATNNSDVTDAKIEKTACNFVVSSLSDGSVDFVVECQNLKHDNEVRKSSNLQNLSNLENDCDVPPACIASCSTEVQLSESENCYKVTSSSPNKIGEVLHLDDIKHNTETKQAALATSSENEHCLGRLPSYSEEQEWSNIANRRESSVCSQVENSGDSKSKNLESSKKYQKKRSVTDSEVQISYNVKFLRSTRHSTGELLPRRSMRLVSK